MYECKINITVDWDILALQIFSAFFNLDTWRNFYFSAFPLRHKKNFINKIKLQKREY